MRGEIRGEEEDLMKSIRKAKNIEGKVRERVESGEKDWKEEEGIITWEGRIYIPKDKKL